MNKSVVIMAGGQGTRIKEKFSDIPKSLIPIKNRTLLDYQIEHIRNFNDIDIHFCLGYKSDQILEELSKYKLEFSYTVEKKPLGTYGALYNSKKYLNNNFFVLFGDIMTNFDLNFGFKVFDEKNSDFLVVSRFSDHPEDSDLIEVDDNGRIKKIFRKKDLLIESPLAITGLFFGRRKNLKKYNKINKPDIFKHYFKENLKKYNIDNAISNAYIKDIGTVERYEKEVNLIDKYLKPSKKYIFLDRDETIIDNNEYNTIKELNFKDGVLETIKKWQEKRYSIFLVTNQPGVAKGFCSINDVKNFHNVLQNNLIKNGLKPFNNIKFCPHHPDTGFENEILKYKIDCNCRKPSSGMVDEIITEFNISNDKSHFVFIGDTENDLLLSKNFKADFYLIKSKLTNFDYSSIENLKIYSNFRDLAQEI
jgi:mannose-1-phosphate guanylyltransferase/phosphomannomutase